MSLAGSFLIARPSLLDPNFRKTVVLLLAHTEEGAFGLVVNRRADTEGLPWPLFVGGPCPSPGLMMLHGHSDWSRNDDSEPGGTATPEVAPGVFIGDASCLERATDLEPSEEQRFRVFSGYAGWSGGQLENELAEGAWAVTSASATTLFDVPTDELWDRLAPPRIPQPSVN
jgi:putative transcriptional regulator